MRTWQLVGPLLGVVGGGCAGQVSAMGGSGGAASGGSPGSGGALSGGSAGIGGLATAGAAGCPSWSECDLYPPPYIDVNICSQIVDDGTSEHLVECIACCQDGGFTSSSFIHDGQCTCGNLPDQTDSVTCATEVASSSVCGTCCQNVGYLGWSWSSSACACSGQLDDSQTCAATVDLPQPSQACSICCINHGYLGATYFDLGRSCTCSS